MKSLFKNKLFKIAGILAILYFGIYSGKSNPNSVAHLFTQKNIDKNYEEAKNKSAFIVNNLRRVETQEVVATEELNQNKATDVH